MGGSVAAVVILAQFAPDDASSLKSQASPLVAQDSTAMVAASTPTAPLKTRLEVNIASLKTWKSAGKATTVTALQLKVAMFAAYAAMAKEGLLSTDPTDKKLGEQLKQQLSRVQKLEFPRIRRDYIDITHAAMFRNNVDLSKGDAAGNREILLTGVMFANNANVEDAQKAIATVLYQLRFKKAGYRWYDGQDSWPAYTMPSFTDERVSEKTDGF